MLVKTLDPFRLKGSVHWLVNSFWMVPQRLQSSETLGLDEEVLLLQFHSSLFAHNPQFCNMIDNHFKSPFSLVHISFTLTELHQNYL